MPRSESMFRRIGNRREVGEIIGRAFSLLLKEVADYLTLFEPFSVSIKRIDLIMMELSPSFETLLQSGKS